VKLSADLARQKSARDALDLLESVQAEERRIQVLLMQQELEGRQRAERRRDIVLAVAVLLMVGLLVAVPQSAMLVVPAWLMLTSRMLLGKAGLVTSSRARPS
jgi:hypothetical protein